jgi:hypothetical protein
MARRIKLNQVSPELLGNPSVNSQDLIINQEGVAGTKNSNGDFVPFGGGSGLQLIYGSFEFSGTDLSTIVDWDVLIKEKEEGFLIDIERVYITKTGSLSGGDGIPDNLFYVYRINRTNNSSNSFIFDANAIVLGVGGDGNSFDHIVQPKKLVSEISDSDTGLINKANTTSGSNGPKVGSWFIGIDNVYTDLTIETATIHFWYYKLPFDQQLASR